MVSLEEMRKQYDISGLDRNELLESPTEMFRNWFEKIEEYDTLEPNAMTLATASNSGKPTSRIVLLKEYDEKAIEKFINDKNILIELRDLLDKIDNWSQEVIDSVLKEYQLKNELSVPAVNQPIRISLTGSTKSPGLGLTLSIFAKTNGASTFIEKHNSD